ncbi:MAG: hypothetical protein JXQ73_30340 [Phycisphaerae bacterium]|nr:hypothetical protein [Phycisphaerae bacterium]
MHDPHGKEHYKAARVGAAPAVITDAVRIAKPDCRSWDLLDDLRVTALWAEHDAQAVCLLSYDVCEITRREVPLLAQPVAEALGVQPNHVHLFCTHTHSSSCGREHDIGLLQARSREVALAARAAATPASGVHFLRVDTGTSYNINRRTLDGPLGTWCLMQSRGCTDDGNIVDGTEWVRQKMAAFGATPREIAGIQGPFPATRPNDSHLDLVLFPRASGGYAGGLVRFTAHAVVCSAGYWRPNLGRDYPGSLCDRLSRHFGCPILFLQGPCGDHRPRHRDVGPTARDRIASALADALVSRLGQMTAHPFDRLQNVVDTVTCAVREDLPRTVDQARTEADKARARLDALPHGPEHLKQRKEIAEDLGFCQAAVNMLHGYPYLLPGEAESKRADLSVSLVRLGNVRLLNFPGELFSTLTADLPAPHDGPLVVTSFADGVTGYLMPPADFAQRGYEWTNAPFTPDSVRNLREAAARLLKT